MTLARCTHAPMGAAAEAARRHRAALPVLETERLVLRAPEIGDLPVWTEIHAGAEARYFGGPYTAESAYVAFCTYVAGWSLHGHGLWSVVRKSDRAVIGFVHLGLEWDDAEPELGWMFATDARGQGLATEAGAAAREYGFGLFETFVSYVNPENGPSTRLAQRLGATHDAAESARHHTGVWRHGRAQ